MSDTGGVGKTRVVVADDHRLTAHAIADSLKSRGYEVVAVTYGVADALDRLAVGGWSREVDVLGFTRLTARFPLA